MIPTPHIGLTDPSKMAKKVLMPGDPLRAKYIADTYLENVECINTIRNMLGFTGEYHGKKVTVFASGMGQPSVGIYSYELFNFYDVDQIIRVGSAGSYVFTIHLRDIVIATDAWSESTYVKTQDPSCDDTVLLPSAELNQRLIDAANRLGYHVKMGRVHSTDVLYSSDPDAWRKVYEAHNCVAADMDSVALFHNARIAGKSAATILTISDCLPTHEASTSEERQSSFNQMMEIALEA